jgi:type IV secretory pathway VirB10-like protein
MSRNTVDFDDLLASLDDLSSAPAPPPPAEDISYRDSSIEEPYDPYQRVEEEEEEVAPPPPPPPAQKSAPMIHKPTQVYRDSAPRRAPAPSSASSSSSPVAGDMRNYQRESTIGHGGARGNVNCSKCGGKVEGDYVVAQGKNFHLNHFNCSVSISFSSH